MITAIIFILCMVFVIGLCIGSFLNVVILRAFSNESIIFPASKCPTCNHKLNWYHNIPVLSYLFLKGKCAFCKEKISIQYPIIELVTGLVFLLLFFKYSMSIYVLLFMWYFASLFIVLAVTDLKEKVIFTRHAYFLIGGALVFNLLNLNPLYSGVPFYNAIINSVLGLVAGILIMEVLARLGYVVAGTRAFGEGDTYIAAGMGALFGWNGLILALVLSLVIQIFITVPLLLIKLIRNKDFITILAGLIFILAVCLNKILPFALGLVFLVLSAGFLCYRILKDLRKETDKMYLPFGPAMILASFILILLI